MATAYVLTAQQFPFTSSYEADGCRLVSHRALGLHLLQPSDCPSLPSLDGKKSRNEPGCNSAGAVEGSSKRRVEPTA